MNHATAFFNLLVFSTLTLGLTTPGRPGLTQETPANPAPSTSPDEALRQNQILYNAPPPPRQGTPGGRAQGGASRGPCQDFQGLTALVPTTEGIVWGQTTQANPTLWFYLPHPLTAATPMEFTLQDANDNYLYSATVEESEIPAGLIQFEIAPQSEPLQANQLYTWSLVIYCDPAQPTESVFVTGTLQPITPDPALQSQLANANPLDQARLYASSGIWYDALDTLAKSQRSQPADSQITSAWEDLLQQVGLEDFATSPFSPCCGF